MIFSKILMLLSWGLQIECDFNFLLYFLYFVFISLLLRHGAHASLIIENSKIYQFFHKETTSVTSVFYGLRRIMAQNTTQLSMWIIKIQISYVTRKNFKCLFYPCTYFSHVLVRNFVRPTYLGIRTFAGNIQSSQLLPSCGPDFSLHKSPRDSPVSFNKPHECVNHLLLLPSPCQQSLPCPPGELMLTGAPAGWHPQGKVPLLPLIG